jgi:hypothetical protein
MIQIHPKTRERFDTLLLQKNILEKHHPDYRNRMGQLFPPSLNFFKQK